MTVVLEHALIDVVPGQEEAFLEAYGQAKAVLQSSPGCRSVSLRRGVERPSRFLLLVEWETLANHLVDFRESDRFTRWRELIGPYFESPPEVDHFEAAGGA